MMEFDSMINRVIQGDCLEVMKSIPDNSIDLVLTDPPYSASDNSFTIRNVGGGDYKTLEEDWDKLFNPIKYFWEMFRVSKQLIIFSSHHQLEIWLSLAKESGCFRQILHYIKTNPMPSARKFYKFSVQYIIWVGKSSYTFSRGDNDIFYYSAGHTRIPHPTVKCIDVISKLINNHTHENDLVLDPFMGSGTVAVACKRLNRRFIGFEMEKKYVDLVNKRLEQNVMNKWC